MRPVSSALPPFSSNALESSKTDAVVTSLALAVVVMVSAYSIAFFVISTNAATLANSINLSLKLLNCFSTLPSPVVNSAVSSPITTPNLAILLLIYIFPLTLLVRPDASLQRLLIVYLPHFSFLLPTMVDINTHKL